MSELQKTTAATAQIKRRDLLKAGAFGTAGLVLAACVNSAPPSQSPSAQPAAEGNAERNSSSTVADDEAVQLEPTMACDDGDEPTIAQTEGPYYTPDTPERTSLLEDGMTGERLLVTGQVLTTGCQPIAAALLDFWHCDAAGVYDNQGYTLRGHQFTDAEGRYVLETIMPGIYPGRTRHIHVKVQGPNMPVLTTQLYFPNEPENARDGIFHQSLVMNVADAADGKAAAFDFVLTA